MRVTRLIAIVLGLALGAAACVPVQPLPPPPLPPPPPPMAITVPFPQIVEPAYAAPPPVRRRAKVRVYHQATSRCPAGMYWSASHRVRVSGTTMTKTVRGTCVVKNKGRL